MSVPRDDNIGRLQLAVNIAHELGHQCLYIYQTADPIIAHGLDTPVFSYIRKANRPAIQATVALAFMVRFLTQITPDAEDREYYNHMLSSIRSNFVESLSTYGNVTFTDLGQLLYEDLRSYAESA